MDSPRLIEHAFPLKQTSLDSVHEKNVRHGHISTLHIWPARRPLAACRAALIATLLPDPGTPEKRKELCEKIGGKVVKKIERKKMPNGEIVEREKEITEGGILHWGRETENKEMLEWFRQEIRKAYGGRAPKVLDPFAGGGAIPLEAMRLGCEATASDINPVAWFILKCTLEYPQKLAGKTYPLPDFILQNEEFMHAFYKAHSHLVGRTKQTKKQKKEFAEDLFLKSKADSGRAPKADLAWHVRAWGEWVLDHARQELARFYPTNADFDLPAAPRGVAAQAGPLDRLPIRALNDPYYVYIIKCADDSFYIGQSDNLERRLQEHLKGQVSWTSTRQPLELIHWEGYQTREEAVKRESDLKTGFGRTWIKREYDAGRLKAQQYKGPRLVPLNKDGIPNMDSLNADFGKEYLADKRNPRWVAKPTVAYLWARTVTCKNCRATIPLLKTRWLCKKDKKRVLLKMDPNGNKTGVVFGIEANVPVKGGNTAQRREHDKRIGVGTISKSGAKCPCCGLPSMTTEDIRLEGQAGRLGSLLTAVVVDGQKSKEYRLPTLDELVYPQESQDGIDVVFANLPYGMPAEPTPRGSGRGAARAFSVQGYGLRRWCDLFTSRQLLSIGTFAKYTRSFRPVAESIGYTKEWQEALLANLAAILDFVINRNSLLCTWTLTRETTRSTFARFALPITWDFAEASVLEAGSGSYSGAIDWIARYNEHAISFGANPPSPKVERRSAIERTDLKYDIVLTDPPYYDAIPYSDLMDFFHVWLRRTLTQDVRLFDDVFEGVLSPKWDHEKNDGELIDDESRHDGDVQKSKQIYEDGMYRSFQASHEAMTDDGRFVIVFAHKEHRAWETLVSAIIRAGFLVDGSWPIQTEMANRTRALSSAALASSVWLVCKKRPATARPGWDNQVLEEMRENIREQLREFWDAGIRGPDFVWAATGPALEAYSKHPVVKKANEPGPMTVSEFLTHVRRMVVDFVVGRVFSATEGTESTEADFSESSVFSVADLDSPTAYYLLHRHDFGLDEAPAGACILYAISCGISDKELASTWDLISFTKGKATEDTESTEDDDSVSSVDSVAEEEEDSGSKVKLKTWVQRKGRSLGYEAPHGKPVPLIDRVHCLMHLWKAGDLSKVDEYLDSNGLRRHELFKRLLQSLIELSPHGSDERPILESISNHVQTKGVVRDDRQEKLFATEVTEHSENE